MISLVSPERGIFGAFQNALKHIHKSTTAAESTIGDMIILNYSGTDCTKFREVYSEGVPSSHPAYQAKMDFDNVG
ncbi:excalibur calcium-binding domain-containing protein [Domibacillus epiphyticus]|uniref:Uncharacterized protein n=1 Tax=Domibacillus epiphyticus TaxID=1714355 RepID=A0A1V2A570_9BACI|nr:excalibur calcium-binding domain-containing protein [Domibacillus epiphyticus]OMP66148.1 hypothetical protein BTO28_14185 [Domibacillus epiphyticus]